MKVTEDSRFKIVPGDFSPDGTLREEDGWHKMDVRWLVTSKNMPAKQTVVGMTKMPPGVKAQHALHRHPNAEEWEYVIQGVGIKHVGEDSFIVRQGEMAFVPRDAYHALENGSDTETLITLWGYCGAASLDDAGYFTPDDDEKAGRAIPQYARGR